MYMSQRHANLKPNLSFGLSRHTPEEDSNINTTTGVRELQAQNAEKNRKRRARASRGATAPDLSNKNTMISPGGKRPTSCLVSGNQNGG